MFCVIYLSGWRMESKSGDVLLREQVCIFYL
jgi:hypothetical protein